MQCIAASLNFIFWVPFLRPTMLWHHKAWLYSFYSFPSINVVTVQILIVLILFFLIKQCCDTTKLDCAHFISSHQTILWHHKAWLHSFYFFPQTMLWHHKAWLYSFYFFPSNNAVTPQNLIVLMLFLPIKQCCDTTKLDCTHSISSHQTLLWHYKAIVLMLFLPVPQCCDTTKQAVLQFMT